MVAVENVTDASFDEKVLKSDVPVVVDVWATWCNPCMMFAPVLEEVAKEYDGKVKFMKLDADENLQITQKYEIMSIPTTMFFHKGEVKAVNTGAVPKDTFRKWLKSNL